MKENTMYNKAFFNNAASVLLYKSNRKNAKCSDIISINHLINHKKDRKISDERIIQQFCGTLEKVVYTALSYSKHLEITVFLDIGKNSSYINTNSEVYKTTEYNRANFHRITFSSIEEAINFLYMVYCLIYPYNEINLSNTIYNNASVKYYINLYYKGVA